ncbi:MAG: hypothetical protein EOP22_09380 [Hyphomicrobiales bacterium]|nr:MAG: hypothetical protein EOP22_09380 [Hyphomicrobiales bacterium]
MSNQNYLAAEASLYLGTNWQSAAAQGPRSFRTAARALRFAIEEAAPVSLRGAQLHVGSRIFGRDEMLSLYRSRHYPLARKNTVPATR